MVLDLAKGMTLDLSKRDGLTDVAVGVNWGKIKKGGMFGFGSSSEAVDLDLSALLFDSNGRKVNTVYYGNLSAKGVQHSGDDRVGDDSADDYDNEVITINLGKTAPEVTKIVFVLVSFQGQDFGDLPYAGIQFYDISAGKDKLAKTNIDIANDSKFKGKVSMVFAAVEKINGAWQYRVIAEPTDRRNLEDLTSICKTI